MTAPAGSSRAALARHYVGNPLALLGLLVSLAVAGYAAVRIVGDRPIAVAVWFVAAAVLHDVVVLPLYAIADATAVRAADGCRWLNHVRVPVMLSLMLLLVFSPEIFRRSPDYTPTTGLSAKPFFLHWLLASAALFGLSALWLAIRSRRAAVPARSQEPA